MYDGGLGVRGLTEGEVGIELVGAYTASDQGRTTAANAPIELSARKEDGTTYGSCDADDNLVCIQNSTATKFVFDADGEMHSDAVIGVGDDWDAWDDLALASDLSRLPQAKFNEMMRYQAEISSGPG